MRQAWERGVWAKAFLSQRRRIVSIHDDVWLASGMPFHVESLLEKWAQMKKSGFRTPHLLVRESPGKGLGVFATADIPKDAIIECCHAIVLAWRGRYQRDEEIGRYTYWARCECAECASHGAQAVLPLGYGCIYNCADKEEDANAAFSVIAKEKLVVFGAIKPIVAGEEILTWWGQGYYDTWCRRPSSDPDTDPDGSGSAEATYGESRTSQTGSADQHRGESEEEPKSEHTQ